MSLADSQHQFAKWCANVDCLGGNARQKGQGGSHDIVVRFCSHFEAVVIFWTNTGEASLSTFGDIVFGFKTFGSGGQLLGQVS